MTGACVVGAGAYPRRSLSHSNQQHGPLAFGGESVSDLSSERVAEVMEFWRKEGERDGPRLFTLYTCWYCGQTYPRRFMHKEHQFPKSLGGGLGDNIVMACQWCNHKKGARTVDEFRLFLTQKSGEPAAVFWGEENPGPYDPDSTIGPELMVGAHSYRVSLDMGKDMWPYGWMYDAIDE